MSRPARTRPTRSASSSRQRRRSGYASCARRISSWGEALSLSTIRRCRPEQLRERVELGGAEIGHGDIADAVIGPAEHIVTLDRTPDRPGGRHGQADEMLAMAID